MFSRISALCACGLTLSVALLQAQLPNLFVLPGALGGNGVTEAFTSNPMTTSTPVNAYRTLDAGVGSFAVLPNLNATKFFVVANSAVDSIIQADATFLPLPPTPIANLASSPTQAIVAPNGKLLAVAAGTVHLFDTASSDELVADGVSQGNGINTFSIAASLDSTAIFALGSAGTGTSQLNSISTSNYSVTATLQFSQKATAVSVGPNGLVYVSLPNEILEVNPTTLTATSSGAMPLIGTPGPLVFTPDGLYAVGINQATGNSLVIASLATHTASAPSQGLIQPTELKVIGVDTLLATSSQGLYQVTISPLTVAPVAVGSGVVAITTTNDVPTSTHSNVQAAYLVSASATSPFAAPTYKIYQYTPASEAISLPFPLAPGVTAGVIAYAAPAATSPPAQLGSLLTFGNNQTILPGAISQPLVVQLLDTNSVPLAGYTIQFKTGGAGTLSPASAITGSNGYALTNLTAPATPGPLTVTATAGSLVASFSINAASSPKTGPSLSIVAGQGQLMAAETSTLGGLAYGSPLKVLATDTSGNPLANLPVSFTVPGSGGTLQANNTGNTVQTVSTNSAGVASVDFLTTNLSGVDMQQGYLQSLVTASAANSNTVTFYITTVPDSPTPSIYFLAPQPGTTLSGAEGSTVLAAVKAQVVSETGFGIPNIALSINDNNANPSLFPSASCDGPGGLVLSNVNGIASCDVTFGPRLGSGKFVVSLGFTHTTNPVPFFVSTGAPATVQITQGNNQTGDAGQVLPLALVVHVTDSGGNVIKGSSVSWQVVTAGTVTLSDVVGVTDSNGNASALATLGSTGGAAQVTVTAGSASATFNLTIVIPTAGIKKLSGDQQIAKTNTAFPLPLTVQVVDSNGNGLPGAQVNFQVTSGTATLGSSSAITDSTGTASTTVMAGATAGTIAVTAKSSTFTATFALTSELPQPTNITIVNGASFDANTGISPGGIATIRGMGILPGVTGLLAATANSSGDLPTSFSGVTITFNGNPAPIYYVQDTNGADQVTVQVPFEVQPGPAVSLTVTVANNGSTTVMVPVKPLAPGIFTSVYSGKTYAVAVRPDGSQVSPTNPAHRGETIQLYVTGLGQATPTIVTGAPGVANQPVVSPMVVGLNNSGVPLVSAVYGPGLIGVYVVILRVPEDTQVGPYQPIGLIAVDTGNNNHYAQSTFIPIE